MVMMDKQPPTLTDVARACSVSLATASKALSPHPDRCDLGPETRARIVEMARQMGWSRDRRRSARARRQWRNIAVLWGHRSPHLGSYEDVGEALSGILGERFRVHITPVPEAKDWRELQASLRLDGAIALGHIDPAILADLERREYPVVLVNGETTHRLHQILADDCGGSSALVTHLIELGHRRIVYVRHPWEPVHYSERERFSGIHETAARAGVSIDDVRGRDCSRILELCRAGATAVICNSYWDVADTLAAVREAGFAVPRDVSIATCHDISWLQYFDPAVTAVGVPTRQMAETGARLLLELITGKGGTMHRYAKCSPSRCGCGGAPDPRFRERDDNFVGAHLRLQSPDKQRLRSPVCQAGMLSCDCSMRRLPYSFHRTPGAHEHEAEKHDLPLV